MEDTDIKCIRIGRNTFGITLIFLGVIFLLSMFMDFNILRHVFMLWPLTFIFLGIEVLYYNNKKNVNIKLDFVSVILILIIIFFGIIIAFCNLGINKVLYNKASPNFSESNIIDFK